MALEEPPVIVSDPVAVSKSNTVTGSAVVEVSLLMVCLGTSKIVGVLLGGASVVKLQVSPVVQVPAVLEASTRQ